MSLETDGVDRETFARRTRMVARTSVPWRIVLLGALLVCMYLILRQGVASWYFSQNTPQGIESAIQWDPANPRYFDALGTLAHFYADDANPVQSIRAYQASTRLSPNDAHYWADLGAAYEWDGRTSDALQAFAQAQQLFPNSPDINWRLANLQVRSNAVPEALHSLHQVLLSDAVPRQSVFALAAHATSDDQAILDQMLPARSGVFIDYLNFRVAAGEIHAAEQAWNRLLELNLPFDLRNSFAYLQGLIRHRELDALAQSWSALARRFAEVGRRATGANPVTNGSFQFDILNGGLDWRVDPVAGAIVSIDPFMSVPGGRALRIDFAGASNLDYHHVFEYVPVRPDTRYRFSAQMSAAGISSDSGPRFEILDAYDASKLLVSTDALLGSSAWAPHEIEFTTGADTRLLIIALIRPLSQKLDNRIRGTVWVTEVGLEREN